MGGGGGGGSTVTASVCITFWVKGLQLVFADVNKQMGIGYPWRHSEEAGIYCTTYQDPLRDYPGSAN